MARQFNGTSDLIAADGAVTNPNWSTGHFTYAGWVNGAAQNNKAVFGEGSTIDNQDWGLFTEDASPNNLLHFTGGSLPSFYSSAVVFNSAWHHIALTINAGSITMYVDGSNQGGKATSTGQQNENRLTFGAQRDTATSKFFSGAIAEWAIWNRTLVSNELVSLAQGLKPSFLVPLHYWPLWGQDSPEPDIGSG